MSEGIKQEGEGKYVIHLKDVFSPRELEILRNWGRPVDQQATTAANVPAHTDKRLVLSPNEITVRENLLKEVRVNEQGLAHCINPLSQVDTVIAAVRVDDNKDASLIPFSQAEDGSLQLSLPAETRIARIGFFIGISQSGASAVLRMGAYPGEPLTTETRTDKQVREVPYILNGLRQDSEQDEIGWAGQIGLENLGFNSSNMRGIFNRGHKLPKSDYWQDRPLLVVQEELEDLMHHPDPSKVKLDEYQLLVYGPQQLTTTMRGGTRGMIGGWSSKAESRYNPLQAGGTGVLEGAFRILITSNPSK